MSSTPSSPEEAREFGNFFSSASSFPLLPGAFVEEERVRGYYIDLRMKARRPGWPPPWLGTPRPHVDVCQWGLGSYDRSLGGEDDEWLAWAGEAAAWMLERQVPDGGFPHPDPYHHTFKLDPPWLSAMAQGQAASLLVRLHLEHGGELYADSARRALQPLRVSSAEGGVHAELGGGPFAEEYPTAPPSFVLNGAIFALYGVYDVWKGLGDEAAGRLFTESVDTLAANVGRWDLGWWSRYDLFPHPVPNVASSAYHLLHISQLRALARLAPRPELTAAADRFERYGTNPWNRRRAFAQKAAFRVLVPRKQRVARLLPWSPFFRGR